MGLGITATSLHVGNLLVVAETFIKLQCPFSIYDLMASLATTDCIFYFLFFCAGLLST